MSDQTYDSPMIFRPDHDLVDRLQEAVDRDEAHVNLKIDISDLHTGQIQTIFVQWQGGDLSALAYRLQNALSVDPELDRFEDYFWLFWRGWSGCLNADLLIGLPAVTSDLIEKVRQGVPLRGEDVRRLKAALEWAFADSSGEWGDTDSWQEGTISPGHLSMRKKVGQFIELRMAALHGPDYENAPINT